MTDVVTARPLVGSGAVWATPEPHGGWQGGAHRTDANTEELK